jgi:hypothetical protein
MTPRWFALLAVGVLFACHEPFAPSSDRGLTLSLTVAPTELQRGEADTITMTLTNTNRHAVSLSGDACQPRGYVTDPRGVTVIPPGGDWLCIALLQRRVLAAGERFSRAFVWGTDSFAPGVYTVHATFTAEEVELTTRPVSVRVR